MCDAVAVHLIIHGRVQGVGYRAWMAGNARRLGVYGWVRNRRDGTVEAVIAGDQAQIATLRRECATGPVAAKVVRIDEATWDEAVATGFVQRPTE